MDTTTVVSIGEPSGWLALGISVLTAVATLIASYRFNRRNSQLQERIHSLESSRERERRTAALQADIVAFVEAEGSCSRLYFRNQGKHSAAGISCTIDGKPLLGSYLLAQGEIPPRMLAPEAEASVLLLTHESSPPMVSVSLRWEDGSDLVGRWDSDLTLLRH